VLVLEVGIRLLRLDRPALQLAIVGSKSPTSAYDPRLGWVNLPDSAGFLRWPGTDREFRLSTNHQGFRFPRDFTRAKQRPYRLAVVGDSQVFGFIVGDDEHLAALLDRDMAEVETYPFGVPGYGPTQEMLLLEDTVLAYDPDVIVTVLFLHNDLNDETENIAYGFLAKPFLARRDGAWSVGNVPVPLPLTPPPPTARRFFTPDATWFGVNAAYRLAVYRSVTTPRLAEALVDVGLGSLASVTVRPTVNGQPDAGFRRIDGTEPACNVVDQCPLPHWLDGLPATVAAYTRMAETCRQRGIRFVALVAPAPLELTWRKLGMTQAAVRALRAAGIDTLSLEDAFMRFLDPMDLIAPDRHWNAEGTRVAADVVEEHVREMLGLDAADRSP
jgi:hypothetical protein